MRIKFIVFIFAFLSIGGWGPFSFLLDPNTSRMTTKKIETMVGSKYWLDKTIKTISAQAENIDPHVLKLGLNAYLNARKRGLDHKPVLTLVDYSKSSDQRRLWVIDLKNAKVLFNTWVSHGKNSGRAKATSFSNKPQSLKSSLGVFLTDESYFGGRGYSLRIKGLEPNINDNAYRRNIVFHGASYVSQTAADDNGMVGRSWGCFAINKSIVKPLIDTIKKNTLVVAYYPDKNWLNNSDYVSSKDT